MNYCLTPASEAETKVGCGITPEKILKCYIAKDAFSFNLSGTFNDVFHSLLLTTVLFGISRCSRFDVGHTQLVLFLLLLISSSPHSFVMVRK